MVLEVYLDPCTVNSRKVLAGLELLGVKYNYNFISYFEGKQKSDEYTKINPMQTVPAAVDGDLVLTESNAILLYAAEIEGKGPQDPKIKAQVNRWLFWECCAWFATNYVYLVEYVVKPLLKSQPDESVIEAEAPKWHKCAAILDEQLSRTKFLAGDEVTVADISVAAPMHLHAAQQLPLDKHPNLKRWLSDIEALPCWKNTQGAVDKALLPGKQANGNDANGTSAEIKTLFNYTKDVSPQLTELYFFEDPKAATIHEPGDDPHTLPVYDGWSRASEWDVDKNGFALKPFKTEFDDWMDESTVHSTFYPEVVEFLKRELGAKRVLVFDHTVRSQKNVSKKLTQETNTTQRSPVMLVHCDYTAESGPLRVKQLLPDEADELLQRRVAFINVWKPLNVVEERPLAMCDVDSAPATDFFKLFLRYRDRTGENYVMRHSDRHKWWYFPKMTPDKVILLKTYESEDDGRARFVGHSAFEDPTSKPDAPMRESVEIRTICFW